MRDQLDSPDRWSVAFDQALGVDEGVRILPKPTPTAVAHIAQTLGLPGLPAVLLRMANHARGFGCWFCGLGEDFESSTHILGLNHYWWSQGLPKELVVFTFGLDGICDCFERGSSADAETLRVIQCCDGYDFADQKVIAPTFEGYVDWLVRGFQRTKKPE